MKFGIVVGADQFLSVSACPACGSSVRSSVGCLQGRGYDFGRVTVPFPDAGIPLYRCEHCTLIYKGCLPSKRFLVEITQHEAQYYWLNENTFGTVAQTLENLFGAHYDLIDVGAWSGGLLAACAAAGGRRSGIDIVQHPDLAAVLRGEFLRGFIDDQGLAWSGEPYDVVTMFDILEHLYEPGKAFENSCRLIRPGGAALIETGNSDILDGSETTPASWWYLGLFEHHMVWNPQSIRVAAERHGLTVERVDRVRHKARGGRMTARAWRLFKGGLCWNGHRVWRSKIALFRLQRQTRGIDGCDHLRVVLRRPEGSGVRASEAPPQIGRNGRSVGVP